MFSELTIVCNAHKRFIESIKAKYYNIYKYLVMLELGKNIVVEPAMYDIVITLKNIN